MYVLINLTRILLHNITLTRYTCSSYTFSGQCNVVYSYNKSQRNALFLKFIFDKELYMFRIDLLSIIRSPNTVYAAIGICHAGYVACVLARTGWNLRSILSSLAHRQHNQHDKYLLLRIQC